jgi:hypothetical protein
MSRMFSSNRENIERPKADFVGFYSAGSGQAESRRPATGDWDQSLLPIRNFHSRSNYKPEQDETTGEMPRPDPDSIEEQRDRLAAANLSSKRS